VGEPVAVGVGIIGCGAIAAQYVKTLRRLESLHLVAVADLDFPRARALSASYPGVRAIGVDALLRDPDVDLVLNLTTPAAHADIALRAIRHAKHVYGEKPLATATVDGCALLEAATNAGVRLGCAPDTVLGTGVQTARKALDDDLLGRPIAATATMVTPGHERWHPNPDFYYAPGGGPLFDMGPYYISALVTLLGPVQRVLGASSRSRDTRTIGSGPRQGQHVLVDVQTHVTGVLVHASGVLSTLLMSFDAVATLAPPIEIHAERGSLVVPDPNTFAGEVRLRGLADTDWHSLPVSAGYLDAARGYGAADMAATPDGVEPRAGAQLALHVLDVMESMLRAAEVGQTIDVHSTCSRPRAVALQELR
jgi:predicted dehydrogenase